MADPEPVLPSYFAYVLGSVVLFSLAGGPLVDWLAGDWEGYGKAAMKGAGMGLFFGLVMFPFERWLRSRRGNPSGPR